jgi:murein DD-endopeptidase MepM/ murein hydrolase activator NlpD
MNKEAKKFLLFLLRIIMFVKRALVRFFLWIGKGFSSLNGVYERTIGPTLFQWLYAIQKKIPPLSLLKTGGLVGFFGRRSTLQTLLFVVLFIIMIPQTRLYTAQTPLVPGQKTLLYALVGPGEQDFGPIEEYIVEQAVLVTESPDRSWRDGAVSADQVSPIGSIITEPADISSITMGGGAVTKPTILPGNELPVSADPDKPQATGRSEVASYVVQPGDTIGGIAEQFRITVATILWANNLTARSYIRPGDTLKILPVSGVSHTVARGDTISSLSKEYDTEASQIIAFNKLQSDGSDIIIGETLIVPGGEKPEPKAVYTPVDRTYTALSKVAAPPPSVSAPAGSGYIWPAGVRTITQYYGLHHTGMDIAGPVGTAVYAAKAGTVIKSQDGWNGGYGNYIIIDHGGGVTSLYGHNSVRYADLGEYVEQGQTIAGMGSTGRSTGPHLHFEVRINNRHTNPLQYIR